MERFSSLKRAIRRFLSLSLCTILSFQTFLFSPSLARAVGDGPSIDSFLPSADGGKFAQVVGDTFYTNDTTPIITATYSDVAGTTPGIDASTASIQVAGVGVGFTTRDSSHIVANPTLPVGTYSLRVVVKDLDGNQIDSIKTLVVDTTAPSAPSIASPTNGAISNNQTPAVTGTAEADANVKIYDGAVEVGSGAADGSGNYSILTSSLAEGSHSLSAVAIDRAGNESGASSTTVYHVDITGPSVNAGSDKIANTSTFQDATTSDASGISSYSWSQVSGPGTLTFGTPNAEDTNISADVNGTYVARLSVVDVAGNSNSDEMNFTWNSTAPGVTIDPVVSPSNNTTPTITGTATSTYSNIASVEYRIDGGAWVGAVATDGGFDSVSENYTLTTSALAEGNRTIEVRATDDLGNVALSGFTSRTFTIDLTAPVISLVGDPVVTVEAGTSYTDGGATWTDAVDGTGSISGTGVVNVNTVGSYTRHYNLTDTAGNAATEVTRTVNVVDTQAPTISGISPADGTITSDANVTVSATFADSGSGVDTSSLWLDVDGVPVEGAASFVGQTFTYTPLDGYDDGVHTVDVSISDLGGLRSATTSWSFTVTSAPVITSATVAGGRVVAGYINSTNTGLTVAGTVPADSGIQTVKLYSNGTEIASTIVIAPATTFSISLSGSGFASLVSSEGLKSLQAMRIGSTYNHSGMSTTTELTVDTVAPAVPDAAKISVSQNEPTVNDTVSGTAGAVDGSTSSVLFYQADGTTLISSNSVNPDGSFGPISIGDNLYDSVNISVRDAAGNETVQIAKTNDIVAPSAPIITTPTDGTVSQSAALSVGGTAEANSTVRFYNGLDLVGTTTTNGAGIFSVDLTLPANGNFNFTAVAIDAAGNVSPASSSVGYIYDNIAPTATVASPAELTNNDMAPISIIWSDAGAGFTVDPARTMVYGPISFATTWDGGTKTMTYTPSTSSDDGTYTITATISDRAGNVGTTTFSFTIDSIAPVIAAHADVTVEATSAAGAVVTYTAPNATDNRDATAPATCDAVSGNTFPIGTTPVTCNKNDVAGNVAAATHFNIVVEDTTAPVITVDGANPMTLEVHSAYSELGATAHDAVKGDFAATPSGSVNVDIVGPYTISYDAVDDYGHAATTVTRTVNVVDTTKPVIDAMSDIPVDPTSAAGAVVTYTAPTVNDNYDAATTATCTPASGSLFAIGSTTVTCTWTDANGNVADPVRFTVNVTDTTAPTIDSISGTTGTTGEITTVTVSAHDNVGPTGAEINIDGAGWVAMTGNSSPFTYDVTVPSGSVADINYVVRVHDAAGLTTTSATQTITVTDNDAPTNGTISIDAGALYTNSSTRTVSLTLSVEDNIAPTEMNFSDDGTTWLGWESYTTTKSYTLTAGDGTKTVYVKYRDGATVPNESAVSSDSILLDTTKPGTIGSASASASITNNSHIQLTWSVPTENGSGIDYYVLTARHNSSSGAIVTGFTDLNVGNVTSYALSDAQAGLVAEDGDYVFGVRAVDRAGNIASSRKYTSVVTIDTVAPIISLTGTSPITVERGTSYTDAGASWTDAVDGSGTLVGTGTVDPNTVGTYTIHYNYTDAAGNAATEVTRTVNVTDTIAPVIAEITPVASPTNNPHYFFSSTEAGTISYGGACAGTTTAAAGSNDIALTGLSSGTYNNCTVTVTDAYTNVSNILAIPSFVVDVNAPTVTANIVVTKDSTPALSGSVDDPAATISIRVNGVDYPATNNGDGTWSLADNTISALVDGIYNIIATATDALGNIGTDATTNELKIDNTAPVVITATPTGSIGNHLPTITVGMSDAIAGVSASTLVMRINGVAVAAIYDAGTNTLNYTPSRNLGTRMYSVTIDGADAAGNVMTRYSFSFTIN